MTSDPQKNGIKRRHSRMSRSSRISRRSRRRSNHVSVSYEDGHSNHQVETSVRLTPVVRSPVSLCCKQFYSCLCGPPRYRGMGRQMTGDNVCVSSRSDSSREDSIYEDMFILSRRSGNSVSKIDTTSRVMFPLVFLSFNLIYWSCYIDRGRRGWHSKQETKSPPWRRITHQYVMEYLDLYPRNTTKDFFNIF